MNDLLNKKCVPCEGDSDPMDSENIDRYMKKVEGWELLDEDPVKIAKKYTFEDFVAAMKFVNNIAEIAEKEGHHPDIHISYNEVRVVLWTHAINGLSENDFIVAAKIDNIVKN